MQSASFYLDNGDFYSDAQMPKIDVKVRLAIEFLDFLELLGFKWDFWNICGLFRIRFFGIKVKKAMKCRF